jgi:hypothetical protein
MNITEQKIELLANVNDSHHILEVARQRADFDASSRMCEVMQHQYRLLYLLEHQEQQEASWTAKLPTLQPLEPVMSAEELKRRLA